MDISAFSVTDFGAKYIVVLTTLRVLSEIFGFIALKTDAKWDNKFAKNFSKVINLISKTAGLIGFGSPNRR